MRIGRLKIRTFTLLLAALLAAASILLLESLLRSPAVQRRLVERLSLATGYELASGPIELSFWRGLALDARDAELRSPDSSVFIQADHFRFALDPGGLLRGRIVPLRFGVAGAEVTVIHRPAEAAAASTDLSTAAAAGFDALLRMPPISFERVKVNLGDRAFSFENLRLRSSRTREDGNGRRLSAGGELVFGRRSAPFSIGGEIFSASGEPGGGFVFDLRFEASGLEAEWMPDLNGLSILKGGARIRASATGSVPGDVSFDGRVESRDLYCLVSTRGRKFPIDFPALAFGFDGEFSDGVFDIRHVDLSTPAWAFTGRARIETADGAVRSGSVSLEAPFMRYRDLKALVPVEYLPGWLSERILDRMSGGQARVDRFALQGTFDELRKFKLRDTPSLLELMLTWRGITFDAAGAEIPFEDVCGRLHLTGGGIDLSGVTGRFAGSEVLDGSFAVKPLLSNQRYLATLDGAFDLEDLARQKGMDFIPESAVTVISRFESARGRAVGSVRAEYLRGEPRPRLLDSEFSIADSTVVHRDVPLPVKVEEAYIVFEKTGEMSVDGSGALGGSPASFSGSTDASGLFQGRVQGLADVNEWIAHWHQRAPPAVRLSGAVPVEGSVSAGGGRWRAEGELSLQGIGVHTGGFSMKFDDPRDRLTLTAGGGAGLPVDLSGAAAVLGESRLDISGSWDPAPENRIEMRISSRRFDPADAGLQVPGRQGALPVTLSGDLHLMIPVDRPADARVTGSLAGEFERTGVVLGGLRLEDCKFRVQLEDRAIVVESLQGRAAGGVFNASGRLSGGEHWTGAVSVEAADMDLTGILPDLRARNSDAAGGGSGVFRDSEINVSWASERIRWKRMMFDRVTAETRLQDGALHVDACRVAWAHGVLEGRGSVSMGATRDAQFSGSIEMESQPLEDLLGSFDSTAGRMTGSLTMEAAYSTAGRSPDELLGGLTGGARIAIDQGVVFESRVIFRVLERLSLQQVFRGRPDHVPRDGFYFELIEADVIFAGGAAEIRTAVMRSPVFNATADGSIELESGWTRFDLYVHPLGTVDSLVSRIPLLGYILAGEEASVIVYRFRVSGKVPAVEVEYVPLRDLGKSAAGYIKRLLLTPGRMFRTLSDAVRNNEASDEPPAWNDQPQH